MSKIFEAFGAQFLPTFPPKGFYENVDLDEFIISGVKSELEELARIRDALKPHLSDFPRHLRLPHERVSYLLNKNPEDSDLSQQEENIKVHDNLQKVKFTPEELKKFIERYGIIYDQ